MLLWPRRLGSTDITVSVLGLGTVKFGRTAQVKYPQPFALPRMQELANLLALARASGINLIDTAPAYGYSEARLGRLLAGQREHWIISTKVGEEFRGGQSYFDFSAPALTNSVYNSLRRLRTDYLDIVLVHSNGHDMQLIEEDEVFVTLAGLQQRGVIRAYGMSTKTIAGAISTITHADLAMISYNYQDPAAAPVLALAATLNKGIMIKKALASGYLPNTDPDAVVAALRYVLAVQGVSALVVGTINPEHLLHNITAINSILSCPA